MKVNVIHYCKNLFKLACNFFQNIYYLLTGCEGCTMQYYERGFEVWTELARSMYKKRGLSISQYCTSDPVNSLLDGKNENIPNIHQQFATILRNLFFTKLV